MAFAMFSGGTWHYITLGLILFGVFFIYLLFTQPQNALYYAEKFFVIIGKIIMFFVVGLARACVALFKGLSNLFRGRGR